MRKLFKLLTVLCMIGALVLTASAGSFGLYSTNMAEPSAVYVIAGSRGKSVEFTADQLERRMGMESGTLQTIVIMEAPGKQEGVLLVDGVELGSYTKLGRSQIDRLVFYPAPDSNGTEITFLPNGTMLAALHIQLSDTFNSAPVAAGVQVEGCFNEVVAGWLPATDIDGDTLTLQLVRRPRNGTVSISGHSFLYEPFEGKSGSDTFSFCAVDTAGNLSNEAEVSVQIDRSVQNVFADMTNNMYTYAAARVAEKSILGGEQIGGLQCFNPDRTVSRAEFTIMLVAASNLGEPAALCVNTGLDDDTRIPFWQKSSVNAAKEAGIIASGGAFNGEEAITRAEAVTMTARVLSTVFGQRTGRLNYEDAASIPDTSLQSYISLQQAGFITPPDGIANAQGILTRDYAAFLLWQTIQKQ